jgi:peptidoglycan L-alanyl-D-glutamate endopeptidase CwlK
LSWDESNPWALLGEEGKKLGLEWGGDFKSFTDRPHFQISNGIKLSVLKQKIKTNSLQDVWNFVSKQGGLHDTGIK